MDMIIKGSSFYAVLKSTYKAIMKMPSIPDEVRFYIGTDGTALSPLKASMFWHTTLTIELPTSKRKIRAMSYIIRLMLEQHADKDIIFDVSNWHGIEYRNFIHCINSLSWDNTLNYKLQRGDEIKKIL